jgi:uncharacterized protein YxeA
MHFYGAIAVSETITLKSEDNMKKLVTTLTALVFALGLTTAGYSQTTATKDAAKPAVKTQTSAAPTQVDPVDKDKTKGKEADKTVAKEADPAKGKKPETVVSKKDNGKKPAVPATETKKEETKGAFK